MQSSFPETAELLTLAQAAAAVQRLSADPMGLGGRPASPRPR